MRLVNRDGRLKLVFGEKNPEPERRIATARVPTDTEFYAAEIKKLIDEEVDRTRPNSFSLVAGVLGFAIFVIILVAVVIPITNQLTESINTTAAGTASASTAKTITGMIPMLLALGVLYTVINFVFYTR